MQSQKNRMPLSTVPYSPWQVHVCFLLEEALFMELLQKEMSPTLPFLPYAPLQNQFFPLLPYSYCYIACHHLSGRFADGCFGRWVVVRWAVCPNWSSTVLPGRQLLWQLLCLLQVSVFPRGVKLFPESSTSTNSLDFTAPKTKQQRTTWQNW